MRLNSIPNNIVVHIASSLCLVEKIHIIPIGKNVIIDVCPDQAIGIMSFIMKVIIAMTATVNSHAKQTTVCHDIRKVA